MLACGMMCRGSGKWGGRGGRRVEMNGGGAWTRRMGGEMGGSVGWGDGVGCKGARCGGGGGCGYCCGGWCCSRGGGGGGCGLVVSEQLHDGNARM